MGLKIFIVLIVLYVVIETACNWVLTKELINFVFRRSGINAPEVQSTEFVEGMQYDGTYGSCRIGQQVYEGEYFYIDTQNNGKNIKRIVCVTSSRRRTVGLWDSESLSCIKFKRTDHILQDGLVVKCI